MTFIQDLIEFTYLRNSLLAILLASIACGIVGGYVIARRQSYMIGAVSHSLLGGIGMARYLLLTHGIAWITPIFGASVAAIIAAIAITSLTARAKSREDAVLSAVWTLGVALGVSFIAMTPGYSEDLNSYLFGSVLLVSSSDIAAMAVMDALIILVAFLFHNRFLALCFHPETLELRGLSPIISSLMLNILIALTVVLLSQIVGIVLVLVMLVLPAAIATTFFKRLPSIMLGGFIVCLVLSLSGIIVSYEYDLPTGATIIEFAVAAFFIISLLKTIFRGLCKKAN